MSQLFCFSDDSESCSMSAKKQGRTKRPSGKSEVPTGSSVSFEDVVIAIMANCNEPSCRYTVTIRTQNPLRKCKCLRSL